MTTIKELTERYATRPSYKKEVDEIFSTIFAECEDIDVIFFKGYTPGFNDGDPCYHSQVCAVQEYDVDDLFDDFEVGGVDEEGNPYLPKGIGFNEDLVEKYGLRFPKKNCYSWDSNKPKLTPSQEKMREVYCLLSRGAVVDMLEREWGTDWKKLVYRTGKDTYAILTEEYYCGY